MRLDRAIVFCGCSFLGLSAFGCAHDARNRSPIPVGQSTIPFTGKPEYLVGRQPGPLGPAGRSDDRVPVAGTAWHPGRDALDEVRLSLARADAAAVELRMPDAMQTERQNVAGGKEDMSDPITALQESADQIAQVVKVRPDLVAEAEELQQVARRLPSAKGLQRQRLINRVGELTDLIRVQIAATT